MSNPRKNAEGYADPTAYLGTRDVVKRESEETRRVTELVHMLRGIARLAGFEIVNRIVFRDAETGKEYR